MRLVGEPTTGTFTSTLSRPASARSGSCGVLFGGGRWRRTRAGMPQTRARCDQERAGPHHGLARATGPLPATWIAADAANGQDSRFRRLRTPVSPTSWPCPSPSRCTAPASNTSLAKLPPRHRSGSPAATAPKGLGSTTGLPPAGRLGVRRRRADPATLEACPPQHHQARRARLLPRISPPWTPPSPISFRSPGVAGESRSASRARRTNAAWTNTESAAMSAITLAMLAHAFLAVAALPRAPKGEPVTTHPTSWTSPRPRSAV